MTAAAPRFSLAPRWLRLPLLLKRRRERRLLLDRDVRLLLTIMFILAAALAGCHMTIREVERHLLRTAAAGAAIPTARSRTTIQVALVRDPNRLTCAGI